VGSYTSRDQQTISERVSFRVNSEQRDGGIFNGKKKYLTQPTSCHNQQISYVKFSFVDHTSEILLLPLLNAKMTGAIVSPTLAGKKSIDTPQQVRGAPAPPPTEAPNFTIADVRAAIPPHLFERNAWTSSMYLARDIAILAALASTIHAIHSSGLPQALKWISWVAYWILAGNVATGVWVIAHECGHQAFSKYKSLNDTVGWVLHSALLVPVRMRAGTRYCRLAQHTHAFPARSSHIHSTTPGASATVSTMAQRIIWMMTPSLFQ
jgi:hypothetical protein